MAEPLREICFDTETTGFDAQGQDRLTEIGCVELIDYLPTGRSFHSLINPEGVAISAKITEITGHTDDSLAGAPFFKDIADDFLEFVGDSALIAHNAAFDRGFINAGLVRAGRDPFAPSRFIDTLMIARELFPGSPASLDALCRRFDISLASRNVHGALIDAELLARVYLELRGGRDRDLDLEMSAAPAQIISMAARQRPSPLRSRLTEAERAAHAEFVKTELGEQAIWTA